MNQKIESWFTCEHPRLVRNRYTGQLIQVGCGHCSACENRRILKNVPNLISESSCWKYSIFFTLTYSDKFLPHVNLLNYNVDKNYEESFKMYCAQSANFLRYYNYNIPVCQTSDIQKFVKRLRENVFRSFGERLPIRYYISWDYGSNGFRPHYHGVLWFSDDRISQRVLEFVSWSWSILDKSTNVRESIGIVDVQHAYNCAKYVAAYIASADSRPAIYNFRDFRPRSIHSSNPSIGSLVRTLESVEDILENGFTEATICNPSTNVWEKRPLSKNFVRRLFPTIPTFGSLSHSERVRFYNQFLSKGSDRTKSQRHQEFMTWYKIDSSIRDYISLSSRILTEQQILSKFDSVYYCVKRLFLQASIYSYSVNDYDLFIEKFYQNRYAQSLRKQFTFENHFGSLGLSQDLINEIIDIACTENKRGTSRFIQFEGSHPSPRDIDSNYFRESDRLRNSLIKRKKDNAYLDRHPEFKQFHS